MSVDDYTCAILAEGAGQLAWAWALDMKDPKSFPHNTGATFHYIKHKLRGYLLRDQPKPAPKPLKLRKPRPPRRFSDLVDDRTIRAVYEYQNVDTYDEAIRLAASENNDASRTFQKILNAVEAAYLICYFGEEAAPKPRTHFLHRSLLGLADLLDLSVLKHEGLAEFLDDLCPCGKRHGLDAIRKLRKRTVGRGSKA
jgi:hypothetical protein